MVLTPEQIEELKKQIFEQVKNFPEDKRSAIRQQVESMTPEQLEMFVKEQTAKRSSGGEKGVFRMIVDGDIDTKKVGESKGAIAVVSKKAVSKGHVLVIPKKVVGGVNNLPGDVLDLARKIAKKVISKLNSNSAEIQTEFLFGEIIINVIPVYDKAVSLNSPRYDASEKEMDEVYNKLKPLKKQKVIKIKNRKSPGEEVYKLRRRIP